MLLPMRLYPEDWKTRIPGLMAALFALAAGFLEDFVFGPPGNRGMGSFLVVLALGLLALTGHGKTPRRSRWTLLSFAVLAPAFHALIDPGMDALGAYLRALRVLPLGVLAFFVVRALDRRIRNAPARMAV